MKFKKVELNAFRAYKNREDGIFDFTLDSAGRIANFISIYAPNGFGKTSFYDGVEWGMTNRIVRLDSFNKEADAERKHTEQVGGSRAKQYILKNKYVDESVETNVRLVTNTQEFVRTVDSIRKGGKDYPPKTDSENKFFTSVILSQDGIDDFLKAHDDKTRYDKFIDYFGDQELAKYYNNIELLENKNKKEKDELTKKIEELNNLQKEPIDDKILESTNKKITELKKSYPFKLIENDFDETKKFKFEEELSEQKEKLLKNIENNQFFLEKLPIWFENSEKYFRNKIEWENAKQELKDYEELNKINLQIEFLKDDVQKNKNKKIELEKLNQIYPNYKVINNEIESKENEFKKNKQKVSEAQRTSSEINHAYNLLLKEIELEEYSKKRLKDLLQTAPTIYESIRMCEVELQKRKEVLLSSKKLFSSYQWDVKLFNEEKMKLSLTIESIKNNIFIDIESDEKYKSNLQIIESLIKENDLKKEILKSIKVKQEQYKQYNEQIKKLLSLGIDLIDEKQTDICPLCNIKQESYEILKSKILNNPFLNELEKDLLEETERINYAIKINDKKVNEIKSLIILDFDNKLKEIEVKLTKVKFAIKKIDLNLLEKELSKEEDILVSLKNQIENQPEGIFKSLKMAEINELDKKLTNHYSQKIELDDLAKRKKEEIELLKIFIENIGNSISMLKQKDDYRLIYDFTILFEEISDIEKVLKEQILLYNESINKSNENLEILGNQFTALVEKYNIINFDEIKKIIEELKNKIFKIHTKEIFVFEQFYKKYFNDKIENQESVNKNISKRQNELEISLEVYRKTIETIEFLEKSTTRLLKYIKSKNQQKKLEEYKKDLEKKEKVFEKIALEKKQLEIKIEKDVRNFFHEELINQIYSKIDPHPEFKRVQFACTFENGTGKLNVYVKDEANNKHISPSLYYSTAQLNVLSLSIFLAKALNAKDNNDDNIDCIFIDDPIQSMDSINILATIDLFRSLISNYGKQIILSTHDENFHRLLERKIPTEYFDSKFIELETFGTVKRER
jgi:exonuclease SbcC